MIFDQTFQSIQFAGFNWSLKFDLISIIGNSAPRFYASCNNVSDHSMIFDVKTNVFVVEILDKFFGSMNIF